MIFYTHQKIQVREPPYTSALSGQSGIQSVISNISSSDAGRQLLKLLACFSPYFPFPNITLFFRFTFHVREKYETLFNTEPDLSKSLFVYEK